MGLWSEMKTWFIFHLLIGYIFIVSGLIVSFLALLCYLLIWPWNQTLYRKCVMNLSYTIWSQFSFLAQWWSGSDCTVFLENIEDFNKLGNENSIAMMNHKYDIDWLMTWVLSERLKILGGTKIYGKSSLRYVPIIGWLWVFTESIFLKREWDQDRRTIIRDLQYITKYPPNYWVTILLFCEGTRFTEEKHKASLEFARKKGLKELKHHLLPRTKGFILTMHGVKGKIPAILDMTVGFRRDGAEPSLMNVLNGKKVKGEMYVRRIPTDSIPLESDEACANWLYKMYEEKDKFYDNFNENGRFTIGTKVEIPWRINDLVNWICWAVLLCVPLFYYVGKIFVLGSLTVQISAVVIVALLSLGVRKMIAVSETKYSGSSYGQKGKSTENGTVNKKED